MGAMTAGRSWTRDELLVALNLYHKLPFGQLMKSNAAIEQLAVKLARTPSSVAMKLSNMASLDPIHIDRGVSGLQGASKLDRQVWQEYHAKPDEAVVESEDRLREWFGVAPHEALEVRPGLGFQVIEDASGVETETRTTRVERTKQHYFRGAVLNNYARTCAVSGLRQPELLVASHILPWAQFPKHRLDVRNGICLSSLYDRAFDRGLISFDSQLRLLVSDRLRTNVDAPSFERFFGCFDGVPLRLPVESAPPDAGYLQRHRVTWGFAEKSA